jgi:hypothetical protein
MRSHSHPTPPSNRKNPINQRTRTYVRWKTGAPLTAREPISSGGQTHSMRHWCAPSSAAPSGARWAARRPDRDAGIDAAVRPPSRVPLTRLEVNVGIGREHPVQVVEAALVDRRGVVDQQLLDFQPIGDFSQAQHASIEHDRRAEFGSAAKRDGRRLVITMIYGLVVQGGPTHWDQAAGLLEGLHAGPLTVNRHASGRPRIRRVRER